MTLSEIWIYPVKSLGGIRLTSADVEEKGLKYDRRWMIIDENNVFITQRNFTKMALIDVEITSDGLLLSYRADKSQNLLVPFEPVSKLPVSVKVWDDVVEALTVSQEADEWLSAQLNRNLKLVIMTESTQRKADPKYAKNGENVSFADGFPFLIISQASLDNLNAKLQKPIEMLRFRPNFVISDTKPHEEDEWKMIQIGNVQFEIVKPCARCVLTTVDPKTSEKGPEPLKTLATYRRVNSKILFGQNLVAKDLGSINQGDPVNVLM